jgi:hypothetical protein
MRRSLTSSAGRRPALWTALSLATQSTAVAKAMRCPVWAALTANPIARRVLPVPGGRSAGFPTRKSLEDFNFDHQPALNRDMIAHLGTGAFLAKASVVLLGLRVAAPEASRAETWAKVVVTSTSWPIALGSTEKSLPATRT